MALGDRFIDDGSVDWGGVGRAVAGSALSGVFLAIIGFIDTARSVFTDLLSGFSSWISEIIPALIIPSGLGAAWGEAASSISGLGPIGFLIAVGTAGLSLWIGTEILIRVGGRAL